MSTLRVVYTNPPRAGKIVVKLGSSHSYGGSAAARVGIPFANDLSSPLTSEGFTQLKSLVSVLRSEHSKMISNRKTLRLNQGLPIFCRDPVVQSISNNNDVEHVPMS